MTERYFSLSSATCWRLLTAGPGRSVRPSGEAIADNTLILSALGSGPVEDCLLAGGGGGGGKPFGGADVGGLPSGAGQPRGGLLCRCSFAWM